MPDVTAPTLRSMAFSDIPHPDWADVVVVSLPSATHRDPRRWARAVFSGRRAPRPVRALMLVRQGLVRLIGVPPSTRDVFDVRDVVGEEAVIAADERHLSFRAAVGIDGDAGLLRVTTAVRFHGWRGRLYFVPVSVLHGPVTRAMMRAAIRRTVGQRGPLDRAPDAVPGPSAEDAAGPGAGAGSSRTGS